MPTNNSTPPVAPNVSKKPSKIKTRILGGDNSKLATNHNATLKP